MAAPNADSVPTSALAEPADAPTTATATDVAETASTVQAAADPTSSATATPPAKSPYDDLLCTICNLKACWMAPDAGGKSSTG